MIYKNKNKFIIWLMMFFAILGAGLSFLTIQPKTIRFIGKTCSFPASKKGINYITQTPNPYRTISEERWVGPLRFFYLKDSEPGFLFIKNILQAAYYKQFNNDVVLFLQFQAAHIFDPMSPECTLRPIYAIPRNDKTQALNFEKDYAEMREYSYYVCDERTLTLALDNYYKTYISFFAMCFVVISILINGVSRLKNNKTNLISKGEDEAINS